MVTCRPGPLAPPVSTAGNCQPSPQGLLSPHEFGAWGEGMPVVPHVLERTLASAWVWDRLLSGASVTVPVQPLSYARFSCLHS